MPNAHPTLTSDPTECPRCGLPLRRYPPVEIYPISYWDCFDCGTEIKNPHYQAELDAFDRKNPCDVNGWLLSPPLKPLTPAEIAHIRRRP